MTIFLYFMIWYAVGVASFVFWWTSEFDFKRHQLSIALSAAILGPFAFLIGFFIHGKCFGTPESVIFKKRN